jgi:peptide/nickel transport system substrate-binding protein
MKRFSSSLIVLASLACAAPLAAATRPHYGGTLRLALQESPQSFDPTALDLPAFRGLSQLIFETLVKLDERGRPQPGLASSWQVEPGDQRWRFSIRSGVNFSDGTPLDANAVTASLRASNPQWKVFTLGDLVMIETDAADADLAAELALGRNGIVRHNKGTLIGTGPFAVAQWDETAKHLTLSANDQYWAGRPFLDSLEVDFGKSYRDEIMLLDLGKWDLIEIAPEEIRRAQSSNRAVITSSPIDFMALVFARDAQSDAEVQLRNALARTIDTQALNSVVFQDGGEPTGALLPNWLSGYGFVFAAGASDSGLGQKSPPPHQGWTFGYDNSDATAHIVADRILLNARDAGITLQTANSERVDLRLVRLALPSLDPRVSLTELARDFDIPCAKFSSLSLSALYTAENTLLETHRIIPLLHLRDAVALRPAVQGLTMRPDGAWDFANVWLSPENP